MKLESKFELGENVYTPYKAFASSMGIIKRVELIKLHVSVDDFSSNFVYLVRNLKKGMEHDKFQVDEGLLFRERWECFEYIR